MVSPAVFLLPGGGASIFGSERHDMEPAKTVIAKCGGARRTAELAGCTVNYVYRWITKAPCGQGGRVPEKPRRTLLRAARNGLVDLTPADFERGWD